MEQAITKPGSWLAAKYNERQLIIVADDIIPQVELLVRRVGAIAPRTTNPNDLMAAEKQADAIVFQTILQVCGWRDSNVCQLGSNCQFDGYRHCKNRSGLSRRPD